MEDQPRHGLRPYYRESRADVKTTTDLGSSLYQIWDLGLLIVIIAAVLLTSALMTHYVDYDEDQKWSGVLQGVPPRLVVPGPVPGPP